MAKVKCPKPITEVAYGVQWENGLANIDDHCLIERLLAKGYTLVEEKKPKKAKEV